MANAKSQVWYREPWPWFLIVLPMTAVVASIITIWLAVKSDDGLVTDDYYKQGMAINQSLDRDLAARALGLRAELLLQGQMLSVKLSGKLATLPETLQLTLAHPTQSGRDQKITLRQSGPGHYGASLAYPGSGRWHVLLEPPQADWRLSGIWPAGVPTIRLGESEK